VEQEGLFAEGGEQVGALWVAQLDCAEDGGDGHGGRALYRGGEGGRVVWPLHDIATANIVWCMEYTRGVGWGSYIAH